MAPKVGDTVFVAEHNELTGESSVSPAIVTYVYTANDGDGRWWQAAEAKDIVDATVFRRNGDIVASTYGKSEQVTVDDGEGGTVTYSVGYATSPDDHAPATSSSGTVTPAVTPTPAPTAQGLSDADIARLAAALRADQAPAEPAPADATQGDTTALPAP